MTTKDVFIIQYIDNGFIFGVFTTRTMAEDYVRRHAAVWDNDPNDYRITCEIVRDEI